MKTLSNLSIRLCGDLNTVCATLRDEARRYKGLTLKEYIAVKTADAKKGKER